MASLTILFLIFNFIFLNKVIIRGDIDHEDNAALWLIMMEITHETLEDFYLLIIIIIIIAASSYPPWCE